MTEATSAAPHEEATTIPCVVCKGQLSVRLTRGRKSGKTFVMLICSRDGRHFRAFINDKKFVSGVLARLEAAR